MTARWSILQGDVLQRLAEIPDESVCCCVTSPPYWGLRDYGVPGQLGLETTPAEYIDRMVTVFREVRRVLRDDGTLWLNIGDSYAGSRAGHEGFGTSTLDGTRRNQNQANLASRHRRGKDCDPKRGAAAEGQPYRAVTCSRRRDDVEIPRSDLAIDGIKPKDMVGIPWMLAFALRADGWWLRQDIIWAKPNPMPESVRDRCTKAHEYLFLLSKSERYYYDLEAVKEAVSGNAHRRGNGVNPKCAGWADGPGSHAAVDHARAHDSIDARKFRANPEAKSVPTEKHNGIRPRQNESFSAAVKDLVETRNLRSVWTIPTEPFTEAHFATFPTELVRPCILAGSVEGGAVLDPFSGSGTTGVVALRHNRRYIGIELNPEYVEMSRRRIVGDMPLLNRLEAVNE